MPMNNPKHVDNWVLAGIPEIRSTSDDVWEPGFDADRQIVYSKLGLYKKFFLRPDNYIKRFYHTLYPLAIEEWQCIEQVKLYDNFCTIDVTVDVRFQATEQYALSNLEILSEINQHIKSNYDGLVLDCVNKELLNLSDGSWVHEGLESVESKICTAVNELLILQNIQSQVACKLKPGFEEFPDVQFAKESVYLSVLKKSFEFSDQQKEELFRQQQQEEKQQIEHKRNEFNYLNDVARLDRQRQALQAENNKLLLKERKQQQLEQFEIKKSIYSDKIEHNNQLKEMDVNAEIKGQERAQELLRNKEENEKNRTIAHQAKLKEKQLNAELTEYEREQSGWREIKKATHAEELDLKHRQNQLEFDTETGYKKRFELQRLAMQEESFSSRKKADVYLKREIELLELEKKRLHLQASIKGYKNKAKGKDIQGESSRSE
jgi:hypothetical protein